MRRLLTAVAALSITAQPARGEAPATLEGVANYRRLGPSLAVGGAPSASALPELARVFHTVVDLRTDQEDGVAAERSALAALRYVSVPFTPESFSSADVDRVAAVLADPAAAPVLLHCHSSNRVGGVLAVLAHRQGQSLDQALEVGREAGLKSEAMVAAVERVVAAEPSPASQR